MMLFTGKIMDADSKPYVSNKDGNTYKNYTVKVAGVQNFFSNVRSKKLDYKEGQTMPLTLLLYNSTLILVEAIQDEK